MLFDALENPRLNLAYFFVILSDFLETLQNQRAYPYAEIRRDHVHQTEASDDFKAMDVQSRIHENKVHLHKGEDHLQHRIDA